MSRALGQALAAVGRVSADRTALVTFDMVFMFHSLPGGSREEPEIPHHEADLPTDVDVPGPWTALWAQGVRGDSSCSGGGHRVEEKTKGRQKIGDGTTQVETETEVDAILGTCTHCPEGSGFQ